MSVRLHTLVLAGAAVLAPSLALGAGTIEGFYGITRPPGTSFRSEVSGAANDPHLFKDSLQIIGGDVMFDVTWMQFGAIADQSWASSSATQTALGALLGAKLAAGPARLDLMGEVGGHRYGNLKSSVNSSKDEWRAYVGLRPGVAFKLSPLDEPGLIFGLWTFVRWDLGSGRVPVTAENAGDTRVGSVKLGGPSLGATLRVGYDF